MRHDFKSEQEKKLRRLYKEYTESYSWKNAREHGHWEEVEPYQKGWIRSFTLRDDIKNRDDARHIRLALELVNNEQYSRREDFKVMNYKTRQYEPRRQVLDWITTEKYNSLNEKLKSYFMFKRWIERYRYPYPKVKEISGYVVKHDFWFVLKIEPNVITHHWIPDSEFESRRSELRNKFDRDNLWPRITKILGGSMHNGYGNYNSEWVQNKYGKNLSDEDFDVEE